MVSVVALPTEVTSPVRLALVTTVAALPTLVTPPVRLALVTTVAAFPTLVTPPVRSALVVTLPAVRPDAVPVAFVKIPDAGVPRAPPLTTNAPAVPVSIPKAVTTPTPVVVVAGAAPAPPPRTKAFAASAADVAQVVPLAK